MRELQRPAQHRQIRIEPLARQQRAARRARHAHDALDADVARSHFARQVLQFAPLAGERIAFEEREVGGADALPVCHARQHFGHQATA
ncbi:MAG: hypothetical protein U1F49_01405 [Rubrivivax sp.]